MAKCEVQARVEFDLFRPQGAIGQGPEGPRKDGRVSLDFIRPRIRPRPFL